MPFWGYYSTGLAFLVPSVGIIMASFAVWYNRHHWGQLVTWSLFLALCGTDLSLYYITWVEGFVLSAIARVMWLWVLFNWVMAPKGYSWSIYRSFSQG
jgi:hypothetical protein